MLIPSLGTELMFLKFKTNDLSTRYQKHLTEKYPLNHTGKELACEADYPSQLIYQYRNLTVS